MEHDQSWTQKETLSLTMGLLILAREKCLSIGFHAANIHHELEFQHFHECTHGPLDGVRSTTYFTSGTQQHETLLRLMQNEILLRDMANLTEYCHTGGLKGYHSHCLKWTPKRYHIHRESMIARRTIATLDCNANSAHTQRNSKKNGNPAFHFCYLNIQKWQEAQRKAATKRTIAPIEKPAKKS